MRVPSSGGKCHFIILITDTLCICIVTISTGVKGNMFSKEFNKKIHERNVCRKSLVPINVVL